MKSIGVIQARLLQSSFVIFLLFAMSVGAGTEPVGAYAGTYALDFDGDNDAVQIGGDEQAMTILPDCKNTKSVAAWVRPLGPSQAVNDPGDSDLIVGDNPRWWGISRGVAAGFDRIWFFNAAESIHLVGIPYITGEWVHLTLVHANGVFSAYKNGILISSVPSGPSGDRSCLTLTFGGSITGSAPKFQGQIDELSLWNRGLTVSEIRTLMNHELTGHESGLAAYYKMSNGSGMAVTDDSDNSYDGTFIGSPNWTASGALAGPDNALDFDGINDFVDASSSIPLPAALTLEAWIYPRDVSTGQKWIAGEVGGAEMTLNGSNLEFRIHDGTSLQGPATAQLQPNLWQHIAATYDGSTMKVFVNGSQGTDFSIAGSNVDQGNAFRIGSPDGVSQQANMLLDEVRLWNTARSVQSIRQDMAQTLHGDDSGLVVYYRFDQYNGDVTQTTLYDVTGNGYHGTLTNMSPGSDWAPSAAFNTWLGTDSNEWAGEGNWSRNSVPVASDFVGIYNQPLAFQPTISNSQGVHHLVLANGSALTINSAGSLTIPGSIFNFGTISNNGSIQQMLPVNGSSDIQFVGGSYGGVIINSNGDDLGAVTVTIRGNQVCTTELNDTVQRCFDIHTTNPPSTGATLTFFFDDTEESGNACSLMDAYHWTAGGWVLQDLDVSYGTGGRSCSSNPRSVRVANVTGASPFVLKSNGSPTAVSLVMLSASSYPERAGLVLAGIFFSIILLSLLFFRSHRKLG